MKPQSMGSLYLILYNAASAVGWALVLAEVLTTARDGGGAQDLWNNVGQTLTYVQTAAALEMLHSLTGLTRSPFSSTFMQVMSRLILVHGYTLRSTEAQAHWSLFLMVGSWALVEIPRYTFYCFAQLMETHEIPSALFWLRYTLFIILYPTGISGEWVQMLTATPAIRSGVSDGPHIFNYVMPSTFWYRWTSVLIPFYFIAGPYMIMNMVGMRKRAYRNRQRAKVPASGVCWPESSPGQRRTLKTNQKIWAASFQGIDDEQLKTAVKKQRGWRQSYKKWVINSTSYACASPEAALDMANRGLEAAASMFEIVSRDGETKSIGEAMQEALDGKTKLIYETCEFQGSGWTADGKRVPGISIKYRGKSGAPYYKFSPNKWDDGDDLSGEDLRKQVNQWVAYGTIETDAANAICELIDESGHCNLSDLTFVLLGATSAMGPLHTLLKHGATIVAVDINRPGTWQRLLGAVKDSNGRIIFPVAKNDDAKNDEIQTLLRRDREVELDDWISSIAQYAGCNLLAHAPEISRWICHLVDDGTIPQSGRVAVGNYTYLDSELHVRLSVACNGIIDNLCTKCPHAAVCFLCTPTDCHVIPEEAWEAAGKNQAKSPFWQKMLASLGMLGSNQLDPVKGVGGDYYLVDGIVPQQGPNYALAKRMQHWMAVKQRAAGHTVASNVAPSTATISVTHNWLFKAAYGGMHHFVPMEVMWQETSNGLMGALLIYDLASGLVGPSKASFPLNNPMELFSKQGAHGGLWRVSYALNTTGTATFLIFVLTNYLLQTLAILGAVGGIFGWMFGLGTADPMVLFLRSPFYALVVGHGAQL